MTRSSSAARVATALAYKLFGMPFDKAQDKDAPRPQPGLFR
jgi:hypothetical protein